MLVTGTIPMTRCIVSLFAFVLTAAPSAGAVGVGAPAPACPAASLDQKTQLDLTRLRGKVVLVDFWATWCPPCKKAMPFLTSLQNSLGPKGLAVVGISVDENVTDPQRYLQIAPVNYPIYFDGQGVCPQNFEVKAMPSTYVLDRTGTVRYIHLGFRDEDREPIREQLDQLLSE